MEYIRVLALLRVYGRQESAHIYLMLYDSFLMPALAAYLGFMLFVRDLERLRWWVAGCVAFGIAQGCLIQVGSAVLQDRFHGRLDLLRAAQVRPLTYYVAHILMTTGRALLLVWMAMLVLGALGVAQLGLLGLTIASLAAVCAGSSVGSLGAIIGLRATDYDQGNMLVAVTAVGFALVSPVFYALDRLPRPLQFVAMLSPLTHATTLLRTMVDGDPVSLGTLMLIGILAFVYNIASYRMLRWQG